MSIQTDSDEADIGDLARVIEIADSQDEPDDDTIEDAALAILGAVRKRKEGSR